MYRFRPVLRARPLLDSPTREMSTVHVRGRVQFAHFQETAWYDARRPRGPAPRRVRRLSRPGSCHDAHGFSAERGALFDLALGIGFAHAPILARDVTRRAGHR